MTLTATWVRTADGARMIVPNQLITGGGVRNDSIGREPITPSASVWIDPAADEAAALALLEGLPAGIRRGGRGDRRRRDPHQRVGRRGARRSSAPSTESDLRAAALAALRGAGIARAGAQS